MPELHDLLDRRASGYAPPSDLLERVVGRRRRRDRNRRAGTVLVALVVSAVAVGGLIRAFTIGTVPAPATVDDRTQQPPTPTPTWSPVRAGAAVTADREVADPVDAPLDLVDVRRVRFDPGLNAGYWIIELAADWPLPEDREPEQVIGYGLVLDTTGDGLADHLIGIDNDAPRPRSFRVWVTDLATGETEEQVGPPYGYPIEFAHPGEGGRGSSMIFTFLPGSEPDDFHPRTVRYYAWASATKDGELVAWDYAPDAGWLTLPEHLR